MYLPSGYETGGSGTTQSFTSDDNPLTPTFTLFNSSSKTTETDICRNTLTTVYEIISVNAVNGLDTQYKAVFPDVTPVTLILDETYSRPYAVNVVGLQASVEFGIFSYRVKIHAYKTDLNGVLTGERRTSNLDIDLVVVCLES